MPRACHVLTILTSKSLSRAGVVQNLSMSTSKSAPNMPVFNDFDFQIALARRRGANFVDILDRRSFATPVFRSYLCELSKRQNYGKTQHFAQFLPAKTSLLSNIDAARATGNFQYSRKLELLNFLWLYIFMYMYPHLHKPKNIQIDCLEVLFLLCVMFVQQNKTCSLQLCCGWKKNL